MKLQMISSMHIYGMSIQPNTVIDIDGKLGKRFLDKGLAMEAGSDQPAIEVKPRPKDLEARKDAAKRAATRKKAAEKKSPPKKEAAED